MIAPTKMAPIARPASCLITRGVATDADVASRDDVIAAVRFGVEHGVSIIQVREKQLSGRHLFEVVQAAAAITRGTSTKLLVNDRADIASAAGADGVQLRADSMLPSVVRSAFPGLLIGCSVHTVDEAEAAAPSADFVVFGPVFDTPGKGGPAGLARLADVCRRLSGFPVIAVGGIAPGNAADALKAGAAGVAAIRAMNEPDSLADIMKALQK